MFIGYAVAAIGFHVHFDSGTISVQNSPQEGIQRWGSLLRCDWLSHSEKDNRTNQIAEHGQCFPLCYKGVHFNCIRHQFSLEVKRVKSPLFRRHGTYKADCPQIHRRQGPQEAAGHQGCP